MVIPSESQLDFREWGDEWNDVSTSSKHCLSGFLRQRISGYIRIHSFWILLTTSFIHPYTSQSLNQPFKQTQPQALLNYQEEIHDSFSSWSSGGVCVLDRHFLLLVYICSLHLVNIIFRRRIQGCASRGLSRRKYQSWGKVFPWGHCGCRCLWGLQEIRKSPKGWRSVGRNGIDELKVVDW